MTDAAARVAAILAAATPQEKVEMIFGRGFFAAFNEDGGAWRAGPCRAGSGVETMAV